MHQRRRRQDAAARPCLPREYGQFFQRLGHRAEQPGPLQHDLAKVVVGPHHALGHAGGAPGVDEELIVTRTLDAKRITLALLGQIVEGLGKRRDGARSTDLDPGLHPGQARPDLGHCVAEFRRVDHRLRIGIVKDVPDLFGRVAVVDVHMGQPRLPSCRQREQVFRPVAHVDRDLVARLRATRDQRPGQLVGHLVCVTP